jgi:hypothetical protein
MHTIAKAESWAWLTTVDWQLCMRQSRIDGVIPTSAESGRHTHIRIRFTRVTMPISQDFSQYTRCGSVMAENDMGWLRTKMQLARSNMLLARGQQSPTPEGGEYLPASTCISEQNASPTLPACNSFHSTSWPVRVIVHWYRVLTSSHGILL